MSQAKRPASLVRAVATTYATNAAAAALSLVNVLIVARALGPTGRGEVAFLIAVGILTMHLATFSVQEANANFGGSEPEARRALAANSLVFAGVLGIAAALLVAGAMVAFPTLRAGAEAALLAVALASIPVMVLKTYLSFLVRADYAFAIANLAWIVGPLTTAVVNTALALSGLITVGTAITAWLGGQAIGAIVLIAYIRRHAGFGRPDARLARRMLGFGAKTHVGRFMEVGNYRVDHWFLGAISGPRELGLYSIAVAWAELLFYLPGILVLVQRPDLVRATPEEAARRATRIVRVALLMAVAATAGLVVAAPVLCATIFGEAFEGSVDDLRVLALGACGIVVLDLLRNALVAQRKPLPASAAIGVAFTVTIALNVVLVPAYGGLGAAIATAAAYTAGGVAVALIFIRTMPARLPDLVPRGGDAVWLWGHVRSGLPAGAPWRKGSR